MKLNFDFNIHFWIGLFFFVCTAISSGTIHLTHAIPEYWIPAATAWASIFAVIGSGYMAVAVGAHNASPQAKLEAAAALPEVKGIVTTRSLAVDTESEKVVATVAEIPKG